MNAADLRSLLDAALADLTGVQEELRELDAAVGDGDLGITVSAGARAVRAAVGELPAGTSAADVVKAAGRAFAGGNPSTFAALVGGGVMSSGKVFADADDVTRADVAAFARAVADRIMVKGKAELGDKTILDALVPTVDLLEHADPGTPPRDLLQAMVATAAEAVRVTSQLQNRRGRAAWLGERSSGHPDPGATAYLRFLEALARAWKTIERPATGGGL